MCAQVIFEDGARVEADVVILATGYNINFPFLRDASTGVAVVCGRGMIVRRPGCTERWRGGGRWKTTFISTSTYSRPALMSGILSP